MKIARNMVVRIGMLIRDEEGRLLETGEEEDRGPLEYLHGTGFLLQAVEAALEGREAGEEIELHLSPEQAFGHRDEGLKRMVSPDLFGDSGIPLQIGETVLLEAKDGWRDEREGIEWMITEIGNDYICLDGNNPWAGKTLDIRAHVLQVRAATGRELWTGSVMPDERGLAGASGTLGPGESGGAGAFCGADCGCWRR